jgi:putative tryptophan/tyrosine transport system substrate-binding protein
MQFDQLKRREFITLLGGVAAWPLAARAQQPGKSHTIGLLSAGLRVAMVIAPFLDALRELGWIDGPDLKLSNF